MTAPRSYLYVPAHRQDLAPKAAAAGADAIVLDLEDAVPPEARETARANVGRVASELGGVPVWVRVNAAGSEDGARDLAALAGVALAGVRLPKAERPEDVRAVAERLPGLAVHCLIESALGLERAGELARAHPQVRGLGLGEADLAADLGVDDDAGLLYARSRCVVAARAAGLDPPVQSVYTAVRDASGLRRSCEAGRRLGFFGRSAIHPAQVPIINRAYMPSAEQIAAARRVVDALEAARDAGAAAATLPDGGFVDAAVAESARRTLALAERPDAGGDR